MPLKPPADARAVPIEVLNDFQVLEVLYEAEAPIVFTASAGLGQLLLAYLAESDASGDWLVLAPTSSSGVRQLGAGQISVREALTSSWLWLARRLPSGEVERAWVVETKDVPDSHLPAPGTPLRPEQDPLDRKSVV